MRTVISLVVCFLMAFGMPLRVYADGPIGVEDDPTPADMLSAVPDGAHANFDAISYDASPSDPLNGEITAASFPYTDDLGRSYILHAAFGTDSSSYWIESTTDGAPNGGSIGGNILTPDQAYILKKGAEERRRKHKGEGSWLQPVWIVPAIEIVLALGGLAVTLYYADQQAEDSARLRALEAQQRQMCSTDIARDTRTAINTGQTLCPPRTWTTPSGNICRNKPILSTGNTALCQGQTYTGCGQACI